MFQRLQSHVLVDVSHTRVLARDCYIIQATAAAHCAVGHDNRSHAAGFCGQRAQVSGCEGRSGEKDDVLEARHRLSHEKRLVSVRKYCTAKLDCAQNSFDFDHCYDAKSCFLIANYRSLVI